MDDPCKIPLNYVVAWNSVGWESGLQDIGVFPRCQKLELSITLGFSLYMCLWSWIYNTSGSFSELILLSIADSSETIVLMKCLWNWLVLGVN